jgi:hypothetical protein
MMAGALSKHPHLRAASKIVNNCSDPRIKVSLGAISVELAEKAEALEIDSQVPKNVHT